MALINNVIQVGGGCWIYPTKKHFSKERVLFNSRKDNVGGLYIWLLGRNRIRARREIIVIKRAGCFRWIHRAHGKWRQVCLYIGSKQRTGIWQYRLMNRAQRKRGVGKTCCCTGCKHHVSATAP